MTSPLKIGCCAETDEPNWRWVSGAVPADEADWTFYSNIPRDALERTIRRPRLSRYRACRQLAAAARAGRFDVVVTHHPLVSCWTEIFCRRRRPCPHVAFAFNFTRLPRNVRKSLMRRAFRSIDRFVVFSEFERALYAEYFGIPISRFEKVYWGVRDPTGGAAADRSSSCAAGEDAICAVGSQGRDYATLLEAMRRLPGVRLVLIATAGNLRGLEIPANVSVRLAVPRADAEAVIRNSRFMVLPLAHSQVACGHVTLVTAMFCSRAIVATASRGIADYLTDGQNGITVAANDPAALAAAIERLWQNPETAKRLGANGRAFALTHCTEAQTIGYVRNLIQRIRTTGTV